MPGPGILNPGKDLKLVGDANFASPTSSILITVGETRRIEYVSKKNCESWVNLVRAKNKLEHLHGSNVCRRKFGKTQTMPKISE